MQICVHIWSVYMFEQWYSASLDVKVAMVDLDWCTATSKPTTRGSSNGAACSLYRHGSARRNARHLNCIGRHCNKLHYVCFRGRATLSWAKFPCIGLLLIDHQPSRGTTLGNTERDRNMEKTWKDFDGETESKMFNSVQQDSTPLGPYMVATSDACSKMCHVILIY